MLSSIARRAATTGRAWEVEVEMSPEDRSSADIRAELQRILTSPQFDASDRNRRFLAYVIEETLSGRAGRIKAYNIATEVFGRDVNFDPQLDPVVRMEARRLRRSLERFYLTDGRNSPVQIEMPKGGYVPELRDTMTVDGTADAARISVTTEVRDTGCGTSIVVERFDAEGDQSIFVHFNHGFTDQIVIGLSKYPELAVFGPRFRSSGPQDIEPESQRADLPVDFVLSGSAALFEGALDVKVMLMQARTGRVLWAQSFERKLRPGTVIGLRDEIANTIVRAVAEPFGAIFNSRADAAASRTTELPTSAYDIIQYYQYRRSYRRDVFQQIRLLLERALTAHPKASETMACLSQVYSDAHRFGFASNELPAALQERAAGLARRAIELAPDSARAHHAQGLAFWHLQDVSASMKAMQTAVALNPNASEIVGDLGLHWSLLGDWNRAVPLLEEARDRKPAQCSAHHTGLSLYHFMSDRFEEALAHASEVDAPDVAHGFVLQAISQIRLGRKADAAKSVERIIELVSPRARCVFAELGGQNASSELVSEVSTALRDAGLPPEFLGN